MKDSKERISSFQSNKCNPRHTHYLQTTAKLSTHVWFFSQHMHFSRKNSKKKVILDNNVFIIW